MSIISKILPNVLLEYLNLKPKTLPVFQLLKLPLITIECILESMEIGDLIHLSLSSKRCHRLISRLKPRKKHYLSVRISRESILIGFFPGSSWSLQANALVQIKRGIRSHSVSIRGHKMLNVCDEGDLFSFTNSNLVECGINLINYARTLFSLPLETILIESDGITNPMAYDLKVYGRFENVVVRGNEKIRNRELKMFLKTCNASNQIAIAVPTEEDFQSDIYEWTNSVGIRNNYSHWITDEHFLSLKQRGIALFECKITSDACYSFIRRWYHSNDNDFVILCLHWKNDIQLNFDEFDLMPFDGIRRSPDLTIRKATFPMAAAMDLERPDGLLASILFDFGHLIFCVWHQRFPHIS